MTTTIKERPETPKSPDYTMKPSNVTAVCVLSGMPNHVIQSVGDALTLSFIAVIVLKVLFQIFGNV